MHARHALVIAALAALCGASASAQSLGASGGFLCPPGSTPVTTGSYATESCVGSSMPGFVAGILPYTPNSLMGAGAPVSSQRQDPIFTSAERPGVASAPSYPPAIGHVAATDTDMSAPGWMRPGAPPKLAADWAFLFESLRVAPGTSIAWMGGTLSRTAQGEMRFQSGLDSPTFNGSIEPYRNDVLGFQRVVGTRTQRAISSHYDTKIPTNSR